MVGVGRGNCLRSSLKKKGGELPGGLVVRIPGFPPVAWVQALVGELRSRKPRGTDRKKKKKKKGKGVY